MSTLEQRIRLEVARVITNASNFPEPMRVHMWGRDLSEPIDKIAAALAPVIAEVCKDERHHIIQDIREQCEYEPPQIGDYGRVELEGYITVTNPELDAIENGAGFDRMCMSVTEWETGMDKVAADALSEAANELRVDPSAEPGTSKRIYNTIYAMWLEARADKLDTL